VIGGQGGAAVTPRGATVTGRFLDDVHEAWIIRTVIAAGIVAVGIAIVAFLPRIQTLRRRRNTNYSSIVTAVGAVCTACPPLGGQITVRIVDRADESARRIAGLIKFWLDDAITTAENCYIIRPLSEADGPYNTLCFGKKRFLVG